MNKEFVLDFSGKTIVVTGGNRGTGYELSRAVARAGANVAIIYRATPDNKSNATNAIDISAMLAQAFGVKAAAYNCDVADEVAVKSTLRTIEQEVGPIAGLVAYAGVTVVNPAWNLTPEDFQTVFSVNVLGVFNSCKAVAQLWLEHQRSGSIVINTALSSELLSQTSSSSQLNQVFYDSSKAAVNRLARGLAAEWAPHSIRVNVLSPGYVNMQPASTEATREVQNGDKVSEKRAALPEEMASQTVLLLSDYATYITSGEYFADGLSLTSS
ncbi:NADP-dependent mannitol dehydrogenase Short=MtDH; AltName: Full=Mannitol 2-dehydrogenase [NADP(+)] [Serendipita indica DSM 11827]|uniref:Probable NADP-dependent mannitol dehydrogenase n=1 Tax=Serendipita indica (strain DSM 11827) TaxID=1109443 RepID=G4TA40_SERID|nr:NADP-dependent mannitol dehydrogenase Short=MtDH; AltName: Full=Mannitol 2-dehydrogenase [NADP(+)] [Serendipita indica DSM 11827]CCA68199.1 probable NADP-dependent mannitol dehydrogenase [Serendipita indica DSM 11827]